MPYTYGAAGLRVGFLLDIFDPHTSVGDVRRQPPVALVRNLPAVKEQGRFPVCSAVTALTMYEQLLLREGHVASGRGGRSVAVPDFAFPSVVYGWAWIYHSGRVLMKALQKGSTHEVHEQLLGGVPLATSLRGLCEKGVLTNEDGLPLQDPDKLQLALEQANFSPVGHLAVPLRVLTVMPTVEAIYAVLAAQYVIGFSFAVNEEIDEWMHDVNAQRATNWTLPEPKAGSPRLATHAAVVTAIDTTAMLLTIQNSFGPAWGFMGFFFMSLPLFFQVAFTGLQFHVLARAV